MSAQEEQHRAAMISGLRNFAAFLEANPGVPVTAFDLTINIPVNGNASEDRYDDGANRAEVDRIAALLGTTATDKDGTAHYGARKAFAGAVIYHAYYVSRADRDAADAAQSYRDNIEVTA